METGSINSNAGLITLICDPIFTVPDLDIIRIYHITNNRVQNGITVPKTVN